jgi:FtsP/CotA-like multicopper oxidase with cupredoxin domain
MKGDFDMHKYIAIGYGRVFLLLALLITTTGTASAAEFYLRAGTRQLTMPDNVVVTMWGFALDQDNDFTTVDGDVTSPGPMLTVPPRDSMLTIHVKNDLPEPVSLIIPGQITEMSPVFFTDAQGRQRVQSFTHEAAANGGEATYVWNNFKPGTYLYKSGTHPAVQVQMGLYGGIKKDHAAGQAYPGVSYDREGILMLSEIDPVLHDAVASNNYGPGSTMTSTIDYEPKYFLLNGQAQIVLTGVVPTIYVGEKVLVRILNAGLMTRVPLLLGSSMTLLSEDGNLAPFPTEKRHSLTLTAGKTTDVMVTPASAGVTMAAFDRRGFVSEGAAGGTGTPTNQEIEGLAIPPDRAVSVQEPAVQTAGGGGGGGGCFISALSF